MGLGWVPAGRGTGRTELARPSPPVGREVVLERTGCSCGRRLPWCPLTHRSCSGQAELGCHCCGVTASGAASSGVRTLFPPRALSPGVAVGCPVPKPLLELASREHGFVWSFVTDGGQKTPGKGAHMRDEFSLNLILNCTNLVPAAVFFSSLFLIAPSIYG